MLMRVVAGIAIVCALAAPAFSQDTATESSRQPADILDGPPLVTAKGWLICDGRTGKSLWGNSEDAPRAIASTTKIMTAFVVLERIRQGKASLADEVTITRRADKTGGSTAAVAEGEVISVGDLLYGLLLPSGNDAATALAEHYGQAMLAGDKSADDTDAAVAAFVEEMNRTAQQLEMTNTTYLDPHGLGANRSTPRDLLRLTHTAMRNETFRRYVATSQHKCTVRIPEGGTREASWKNTNQALAIEGFDGVKTGTTNAAGACLVASCHRGDDHLLIVVLGSTSADGRYVDARNLLRWAWLQRQKD